MTLAAPPLTPAGEAALARAQHAPLEQHPEGRRLPHPATLRALTRRGLLTRVVLRPAGEPAFARWTITPSGREALTEQPPRLLHRRSERGYTTTGAQAMAGEPEAVDSTYLAAFAERARAHQALRTAQNGAARPLSVRVAALEDRSMPGRHAARLKAAIAAAEKASR